jgi:hypothetical protein
MPLPFRKRIVLSILWLIAAVCMGFVVSSIDENHGHAVFLRAGLYVGLSGGLGYLLLSCMPSFGRLDRLSRWMVNAAVAALPAVAVFALNTWPPADQFRPGDVTFFYLIGGRVAFAFLGAFVVIRIETQWAKPAPDPLIRR